MYSRTKATMRANTNDPITHTAPRRRREAPTPEARSGTPVAVLTREVSTAGEPEDSYSITAAIAWKQGQ
jgi:hypothetical protein